MEEEIVFTGDALKKAVFEVQEVREQLIESLVPKKSTTMFFAPDGIGKSTIILQSILESSSGTDVFGGLRSRPMNTILLLTERPKEEAFERIRYMHRILKIEWENLIVDDTVRGYDLCSNVDYSNFLERILFLSKVFEKRGGTDYVFIDTLYGTVSEGLSSEKAVGQVNKLLRRLQSTLGNANGYTHHSNRGIRNKTGKRIAEDMYGNRSLSSNCTGIFHITKTKNGTKLENKKDSLECLIKEINLKFDMETYLSFMQVDKTTKFLNQKIEDFLKICYDNNKTFSLDFLKEQTGGSISYLRGILAKKVERGQVINLKAIGEKALYQVIHL